MSEIACTELRPDFESYLLEELPLARMSRIRAHLASCHACREAIEAERARADRVIPCLLAGAAQEQLTPAERAAVAGHLAWCGGCRRETLRLRRTDHELVKNLAQYQLPPHFTRQVLLEWQQNVRPVDMPLSPRGGLSGLLLSSAKGNLFSYQRILRRYADFTYISAYLHVDDFQSAMEITREFFRSGLAGPSFRFTEPEFRAWIVDQIPPLARESGWPGTSDSATAEGLSGYHASRKLRRHRLILGFATSLPEEARLEFLLHYVGRLSLESIGELLEQERADVLVRMGESLEGARHLLERDEEHHGEESASAEIVARTG